MNHRFRQMFRSSILLAAIISLWVVASQGSADSIDVKPISADGGSVIVESSLTVVGNLKLNATGKNVTKLPLRVNANQRYAERRVGSADNAKFVRYYTDASAEIEIDKSLLKPILGDDHRLIVVEPRKDKISYKSPAGPLKADEVELIDVQFNSCLLPALLPEDPKSVGQKWTHKHELLARLLGLDAIIEAEVESQLEQVTQQTAIVRLAGTIHGATGGVASEIRLNGKYTIDLSARRIILLEASFSENRSIGHAEPGFEVSARIRVQVTPNVHVAQLSDSKLAGLHLDDLAGASPLSFESAHSNYRLLHDRRWRVMSDHPNVAILRMVDRGDLIAQCNISKLSDYPDGKYLQLEEFQADVRRALGERFAQFIEAAQSSTDEGHRVLRVVAAGVVSELPIHWIYYHISDSKGQRASLVFTMESKLIERFADADRTLADSLFFLPTSKRDEAASPTPARNVESARTPIGADDSSRPKR